jgi:hypothetical protein
MIELTPEQQQAIDAGNGSSPVLIDSQTLAANGIPEMSEGIRRSKAGLRRDLPMLLANRRARSQYACYHLDEQVGISSDYLSLVRECNRRHLPDGTFIIERIKPGAGSEEEVEIEGFDV